MGFGWGSRLLSLVGTLGLTFFLDRETLGEVSTAAILVATANQFSMVAIPNYLSTRKALSSELRWTAVSTFAVLGIVALALVVVLAGPIGRAFDAPRLAAYAPGLAAGAYLMRLSAIPEVLLQRDLQFRAAAGCKAAGDICYAALALGLAARGFGGQALVIGNLVRGAVVLGLFSRSVPLRAWLAPASFSRAELGALFGFGLPLTLGVAGNVIVRQWDNWLILGQFGPGVVGAYGQAYNLADVPAVQVTEQVGDMAAPSFARLDLAQKKEAVVHLLAALALAVFPLSVGLALVAPTFVALLRPEWASMAPLLSVLALMALARPLGWTLSVYFQTTNRPRTVMWLMLLLMAVLFPSMTLLGRALGPEGACAGVVLAFSVHALASMAAIAWGDGLPMRRMLEGPLRALLACAPLALFVWGARAAAERAGLGAGWLRLVLEIVAGALGYGAGAWLFAMPVARSVLAAVRAARHHDGTVEQEAS